LFIACRLSAEKGIFDLPEIVALAKKSLPDLKLVIAGSGPAEEELKLELPDALFLGWVDRQMLASVYAGMDLFVFPSRFDTFGNVLLEAFAYGMPAVAYDCKGPRDIIEHNVNGYLAGDTHEMAALIISHFRNSEARHAMRVAARLRAAYYSPDRIMTQYVEDLGLPAPVCILEHRSAA
jgi:glycosyltransferase involved in cell wall biosynthesis